MPDKSAESAFAECLALPSTVCPVYWCSRVLNARQSSWMEGKSSLTPGRSCVRRTTLEQTTQVAAIPALVQWNGKLHQMRIVDPTVQPCDLFRATDPHSLSLFNRLYVLARLQHRL